MSKEITDWSKFKCRGKCYVASKKLDFRCASIDPKSGKQCTLHKNHLNKNHIDYSVEHIHCNMIESLKDEDHSVYIWEDGIKLFKIRTIRCL